MYRIACLTVLCPSFEKLKHFANANPPANAARDSATALNSYILYRQAKNNCAHHVHSVHVSFEWTYGMQWSAAVEWRKIHSTSQLHSTVPLHPSTPQFHSTTLLNKLQNAPNKHTPGRVAQSVGHLTRV